MPRMPLAAAGVLVLAIAFALYAALGAYTYYGVVSLGDTVAADNAERALLEVDEALERMLEEVDEASMRLVDWQEVRQQLASPAYYVYWHDQRVPTRALPGYVLDVELYDPSGLALQSEPQQPFEVQLQYRDQRPVLVHGDDRDYLLINRTVRAPQPGVAPLGYLVMAIDLRAALEAQGPLRYAQLEQRVTTLPASARIPSSDISNKLLYRVRGPEVAERYVSLITASFFNTAGLTLVLIALLFFAVSHFIATPLRRLSGHIDALNEDAKSAPGSVASRFAISELETVRRSLNDYQSRLEVVHRGLDRKNRRLWKLAHHDSLTGCLNRRAFEDDWRHILELSAQRRSEVSLILVDCNHFKAINDSYGHSVGDEVLKGIAVTVRRILDHSDRLYRIASDEFAVIFVDAGHAHSIDVGKQCLASIEQHGFTQLGIREPVRISVGIAYSVSGEPEDLQALYRRANVAMFRAKRPETPGLAIYSADMEESAEIALSSEAASAVDQAISDGVNLQMHYQPVFSLPERELQYYESLVRLRIGERLMAPEEFFLQIATRRLDTEFDEAVFEALVRDLEAGRLPPGKGLSINVSGASLVDQDIEQSLSRFVPYLSSHKLLLEVTETTMITQLQLASHTLARLREQGFSIALDDFGSGYSSLRYLADMPVDVVKFDITLVHAMCEDSARGQMLGRLVEVLRQPGYKLVAEGVEDEVTAERVTALGFDYAQGFLLGRPQPLD